MKSPEGRRRQDQKGELTMRTSSDSHTQSPSSPSRRGRIGKGGEIGPRLRKLINQQTEEMRKYMREQLFFESIPDHEIDQNLKLLEDLNNRGQFNAMLEQYKEDENNHKDEQPTPLSPSEAGPNGANS